MAKMKKETVKIYRIEAMKQMVNCPAWAQVNQDFADGKFKAAVGVSKSPVGYYLNVDSDATNTFARITKVTKDDGTEVINPLEIASLLDDYISKDHEVNNLSITGSIVTGDFCQVKITTTTRKKTASKASSANGSYADVMQEHIDEMVALGAMVKKDGDLILQILDEHKITNDALLCEKIYRYWKNHFEKFGKKDPKQIKVPKPYYKDPALEEEIQTNGEGIISEGIRCALSGHGVIAQGGKSVGKNVWTDTLAFILYVPISLLTFSRQMAPSALYGDKSTDNSAIEELYSDAAVAAAKAAVQGDDLEKAVQFELMKARASSVRIVQDQSELYDALQYGRLMCFNEMNMADANMFASFANQMLDGTGFLYFPGRGEVEIPREFVFVGTQNEDYEGTESQNDATMSRLAAITFPQPKTIIPQIKAAVEAEITKSGMIDMDDKFYKDADKCYKQVEKFYEACRSASINDGTYSIDMMVSDAVLNIRGLIRAIVEYLEAGGFATLRRKIEIQVINTCPSDERATLLAMLGKYINC